MRFSLSAIYIVSLIFLILVIGVENDSNEKKKRDDLVEKEFEATEEFQPLRPGQAIPAGLHVRINLETGLKEARKMKENHGDTEKVKSLIMEDPKTNVDGKFDNIQDALNNAQSDSVVQEKVNRYYQEQYEYVTGMSDLARLQKVLADCSQKLLLEEQGKQTIGGGEKDKANSSMPQVTFKSGSFGSEIMCEKSEIMEALAQVKELVDHIDLGAYWVSSGGFEITRKILFKVTDSEIRSRCASVLGFTLQNNDIALNKLKDRKILFGDIFDLLSSESGNGGREVVLAKGNEGKSAGRLYWKTRLLHVLSSLLLQSSDALELQDKLVSQPGYLDILEQVWLQTKSIRVINLFYDLIMQQQMQNQNQKESPHKSILQDRLLSCFCHVEIASNSKKDDLSEDEKFASFSDLERLIEVFDQVILPYSMQGKQCAILGFSNGDFEKSLECEGKNSENDVTNSLYLEMLRRTP